MNHEPNTDWLTWSRRWQAVDLVDSSPASVLSHRARSRGRLLALWVACEVTAAAAAVVSLSYRAVVSELAIDRLLLSALAISSLSILVHAVWNWHDAWSLHAESQRTFLSMSLLRCFRFRRAIRAGWCLLGIQIACLVPWIVAHLGAGASVDAYCRRFGLLAVLALGAVVYLTSVSRWVVREEAAIRALGNEIGDRE